MSVLPGQKLTIGELYLAMAIGLILFLMPNDIHNSVPLDVVSEGLVAIAAVCTIAVFVFIIKRYEAVGAALLTYSVITVVAFGFGIINGIFTKGSSYWPAIPDYQLKTMFIVWTVTFAMMVLIRLFIRGSRDSNDHRAGFSRFLSLSLRALVILYLFVIVFKQIMPHAPDMVSSRQIGYVPFSKIIACFTAEDKSNILYVVWNSLIIAPLTFCLLILNSRIKLWQVMIISFAFGLTIEIIQFSLNTGTVYVDDLIMYMVGGAVGMALKILIDGIRSLITGREERHFLSLSYTPIIIHEDESQPDHEALAAKPFENAVVAVEEDAEDNIGEAVYEPSVDISAMTAEAAVLTEVTVSEAETVE